MHSLGGVILIVIWLLWDEEQYTRSQCMLLHFQVTVPGPRLSQSICNTDGLGVYSVWEHSLTSGEGCHWRHPSIWSHTPVFNNIQYQTPTHPPLNLPTYNPPPIYFRPIPAISCSYTSLSYRHCAVHLFIEDNCAPYHIAAAVTTIIFDKYII